MQKHLMMISPMPMPQRPSSPFLKKSAIPARFFFDWNECVAIEHEGASLDLLGVDDWRAGRFLSDHGYDFASANAGRDLTRTSVLLSHQPKAIHDASKGKIDLVLSGHTHGGQIWPGKYLVKLVQPYVSGLHRHSDRTWIYVHSGTGYWGPPVRVGVPSEIALIRLKRGPAQS